MGKFIFENQIKVEFDDRLLYHLQQVITSKLRRNESFTFSWKEDLSVGGGRVTVWVHPRANLVYKFHGGRTPALSQAWLQALSYTASGPNGLYAVREPDARESNGSHGPREPMTFRLVPDSDLVPAHAG